MEVNNISGWMYNMHHAQKKISTLKKDDVKSFYASSCYLYSGCSPAMDLWSDVEPAI